MTRTTQTMPILFLLLFFCMNGNDVMAEERKLQFSVTGGEASAVGDDFTTFDSGFANSTPSVIEPDLEKRTATWSDINNALPYAELSAAIYGCGDICPEVQGVKGWWRPLLDSQSWIEKLEGKRDKPMGFRAAAFTNDQNDLAIVYEGTSCLTCIKDWVTNIVQPFWHPSQYIWARSFADSAVSEFCAGSKAVTKECNPNIVAAGHSLGGALAQYVALNLGIPAYTFNSAGLWGPTSEEIDMDRVGYAKITLYKSAGYRFGKKTGPDLVPYWGVQFEYEVFEIPIEVPLWAMHPITHELFVHNMERLRDAMIDVYKEQIPVTAGGGDTWGSGEKKVKAQSSSVFETVVSRAKRLFIGTEVRSSSSCSGPGPIGIFNSAAGLVFSPSGVLFVTADEYLYADILDDMTVSCSKLLPKHYAMFGEAIALFEASDRIVTICGTGGEKKCFGAVFDFADVTGDGQLTTAEVARMARALAFYLSNGVARSSSPGRPAPYEGIYAGTAAMGLLGPVFAKSFVTSVDFDGNGAVSIDELLQDRGPDAMAGGLGTIASVSTQAALKGLLQTMSNVLTTSLPAFIR